MWALLCDTVAALIAMLLGQYGLTLSFSQRGSILFALVYLVFPIDVIPDVIPVLGLIDDMAVVSGVLAFLGYGFSFVLAYVRAARMTPPVGAVPEGDYGDADAECAICFADVQHARMIPCGHRFCVGCASKLMEMRVVCPFCRRALQGYVPDDPAGQQVPAAAAATEHG